MYGLSFKLPPAKAVCFPDWYALSALVFFSKSMLVTLSWLGHLSIRMRDDLLVNLLLLFLFRVQQDFRKQRKKIPKPILKKTNLPSWLLFMR